MDDISIGAGGAASGLKSEVGEVAPGAALLAEPPIMESPLELAVMDDGAAEGMSLVLPSFLASAGVARTAMAKIPASMLFRIVANVALCIVITFLMNAFRRF